MKRSYDHDEEGKVVHDHDDRSRSSIGTSDTTIEGGGGGGGVKDSRTNKRLSALWSAGMEIDEDDYVIEDKESICLGEDGRQPMLDRTTLCAMEGQSISTSGDLPLAVALAAAEASVDSGGTASSSSSGRSSSNNIMMMSNSSNHGSSSNHDDDVENRYSQGVRHTSASIDNSYDRIEAQDLLHDEQKLLESIV